MSEHRVVVVGGGVIGVCCAYFLARKGADVVLVERDDIAKGASYGSAGTVAAGHPPLNKPGRIRRSIMELLDPKSPLYIPVRWDPGLVKWLWTFRRYCTDRHLEVSMERARSARPRDPEALRLPSRGGGSRLRLRA